MAVVLSLGIIVGSLSILSFIKRSQTSQAAGLQIQSVFPRIGTPAGGDKVRIRGKDFIDNIPLPIVQVSSSASSSCALGSNNKAYCWGSGYRGKLGNNTTTNALTPVAVHQGEIPTGVILTQISARGNHACALGSNSKAYCWGNGDYGVIGNGVINNYSFPVAVHQGEIPTGITLMQISIGENHICALGSDGKAYCWGKNDNGQLSNNNATVAYTPVAVHQGQIPTGVNLTQISVGSAHTCALGSDSKAYCWGSGSDGQLGNNSTTNALTPVAVHQGEIPIGTIINQITAGRATTCAHGSDSKAYCWGRGASGQLGNNSTAKALTPVAVHRGEIPTGVSFAKIATRFDRTCAIGSDGKAYCWGENGLGQLGNNLTTNALTPVAVHQGEIPLEGTQVKVDNTPVPVKYISPYELEITMPAHSAGKVNITVINPDNTTHTLSQAYEYYQPQNPTITSITPNTSSVAGNKTITVNGTNFDQMKWKQVSAKDGIYACGVNFEGKAYCWGGGSLGRLGNNSTDNALTPVAVHQGEIPSGVSLVQISIGQQHTCALGSNGKAYCWGSGSDGRLGNNSTTNALTPVAVHQGQIPNDTVLTQVSASLYHTCALGSNGKAYCWGHNLDGQLGTNSTTEASTPVAVHQGQIPSGVTLTQILASHEYTCALGSNGKAYCWGSNEDGQLGNNSTTNALTPITVNQGEIPAGVSLTQISLGEHHTCVTDSSYKIYCWGKGNFGQLGNNSTTDALTPVRVHDHLYSITAGTANATNTTTLKNIQLSATNPNQLTFTIPPATQANSSAPAPHAGTIPVSITHQLTGKTTNTLNYTYYTTPPAPTNLTTTTTLPLGSITLSFKSPSTASLDNQANAGNNYSAITDYRIDYCLANSAGTACQDPTNTTPTTTNPTNWLTHTHTPLISTSTNPLSLTIPNLTKPGKYLFRVAAINQAGLGTYAQSTATLASYVSLQTNSTLGINLTPIHNQTYSSNKLTLTSGSNLTAGHKLTMTSTTTNNQLTHTTISANTINSTTHSFTSPNTLTPNTWGFYIPNTTTNQQHNTISYSQFSNQDTILTNQSNPNLKHAQLPTTPLTIANYNQPLTNQPLNLIFGINISNTQPSGNYQATMKFEVVGN